MITFPILCVACLSIDPQWGRYSTTNPPFPAPTISVPTIIQTPKTIDFNDPKYRFPGSKGRPNYSPDTFKTVTPPIIPAGPKKP